MERILKFPYIFFLIAILTFCGKKKEENVEHDGSMTGTSAFSEQTSAETLDKKFVIASGGLRIRKEPSLEGDVVGLIPENVKVDVLENSQKYDTIKGINNSFPWYKIRYNELTGYAYGGFLTDKNPSNFCNNFDSKKKYILEIRSDGMDGDGIYASAILNPDGTGKFNMSGLRMGVDTDFTWEATSSTSVVAKGILEQEPMFGWECQGDSDPAKCAKNAEISFKQEYGKFNFQHSYTIIFNIEKKGWVTAKLNFEELNRIPGKKEFGIGDLSYVTYDRYLCIAE